MMNFHYPIRKPDGTPFTDASELFRTLEKETYGHYLMGSNRFWHGGIHITDQSAPQCVSDDALRCMADGEVVAYRLNDDYRQTTFGDAGQKLKYSNSFCLVRHEYASEPNPEEGPNHGKRNTLTFYSLYMHLLPYNGYRLPERVRPGYWQGKVRATAIERLPLYGAPVNPVDGQPAGARIGNRELCVSSVIEFDSCKVLTLMTGNQRRRMAECSLISGGCWGPEPVPATFWTMVENEAPSKFVAWGPVTPTTFDEVISTRVLIKAGDPVGYLGNIEDLTSEQGGTDSAHQVHLELFATGSDVKGFLLNTAGLRTGQQFLHLPSATVLKKKAPATGSVELRQKHVIDLSVVPIVQDGGEDCYDVSVMERDKPVSGLLKKTDADIISEHDWDKLGFQIIEESNAMADGFVDPDDMPRFFRDLCAKIDTDGDSIVEPDELKAALMDPATRDQSTRLVAHHPTEWKEKADSPKWSRLDQLFPRIPKTLKHEKQRIDNYVFWDELSGSAQMASGLIYHFHPIAFIGSMLSPTGLAAPNTCSHPDMMEELANYIADEVNRNIHHPSVIKMKELLSYDVAEETRKQMELPWYAQVGIGNNAQTIATANMAVAMALWTERVGQDRPWDHKPKLIKFFGANPWHKQGAYDYFYDIWSNIHYGYVGVAGGLSDSVLLDGAGVEQIGSDLYRQMRNPERFKGPRRTEGVEGMRAWDDVPDRVSIMIGMNLYKEYPNGGVNAQVIMDKVLAVPIAEWAGGVQKHVCK